MSNSPLSLSLQNQRPKSVTTTQRSLHKQTSAAGCNKRERESRVCARSCLRVLYCIVYLLKRNTRRHCESFTVSTSMAGNMFCIMTDVSLISLASDWRYERERVSITAYACRHMHTWKSEHSRAIMLSCAPCISVCIAGMYG
jgi:hypothetical protein